MSKWDFLRADKPHFCYKCATPMKQTSKDYFLGRDCLGEQYETVYYWQCPSDSCKNEERIFGTHD